ncbi:hypothetical protein CYMTET_21180, partial [Cymbomonas tetramitiformis]
LELGGLVTLSFVAAAAAGRGWMPVDRAAVMAGLLDYVVFPVLVAAIKKKCPAAHVTRVFLGLWTALASRGPGTAMLGWIWKAAGGLLSAIIMISASSTQASSTQDSQPASRNAAILQQDDLGGVLLWVVFIPMVGAVGSYHSEWQRRKEFLAQQFATLTVLQICYLRSGGAATCEDSLEAYLMVVMWLSQGTVLLCGGNLPREQLPIAPLHMCRHSWETTYWQKMMQDGLKAWQARSKAYCGLALSTFLFMSSMRFAVLELGVLTAIQYVAAAAAGRGWMPTDWACVMVAILDYLVLPLLQVVLLTHNRLLILMFTVLLGSNPIWIRPSLMKANTPAAFASLNRIGRGILGAVASLLSAEVLLTLWHGSFILKEDILHSVQFLSLPLDGKEWLLLHLLLATTAVVLSCHSEHKYPPMFGSARSQTEHRRQLFLQYLAGLHGVVMGVVVEFEVKFLDAEEVTLAFTYASRRCSELLYVSPTEMCSNAHSFLSLLIDEQSLPSRFHRTVVTAAQNANPVDWVGSIQPHADQDLTWINLTARCVRVDTAPKIGRKVVRYTGMFTDYQRRKHLGQLWRQRTVHLSDNRLFHVMKNDFTVAYYCAERLQARIKMECARSKHNIETLVKHVHNLQLVTLQVQSECHCRAMVNNILEGVYGGKKSLSTVAAVLDGVLMNKFRPHVVHVIPSEAVNLTMLVDIKLFSTTLILLLSDILANPVRDLTAAKLIVHLKIMGTDVTVDIKDSLQRSGAKLFCACHVKKNTILDHLLNEARSTPDESEVVNGISAMQELRSVRFKGMISMRPGDPENEKLHKYV